MVLEPVDCAAAVMPACLGSSLLSAS
ncbi:MAG: hypothetical protein QOD55_952, partial [Solirubrobacteraceae bacterium]|nr:hypothetical protein [Solirubrobacteraceae bacterium]